MTRAVLETTYTTDTGEVRVTDLMPTGDRRADVVRRVEGVRGTVLLRHGWMVRFDYGRIRPWVHREKVEGAPGDHRHRWAGQARSSPGRASRPRSTATTRRPSRWRPGDRLDFTLTWVPSYRDIPDAVDIDDPAGLHPRGAAEVGGHLRVRRPWRRAGRPQPGHPARPDPCRHRRHRRRADDLAARGVRRGAQLGLPLLLAARRRADAGVAARRRARRQCAALAQLAAARDRRRPGGHAGDVHRRGRPAPPRARARPPRRVRRLPSGAHRQRGGRAAPDRRARRGDGRAVDGAQPRASPRPATAGACSAPWSTSSPTSWQQARQRHVGDPRPNRVTSPTAG